MESEKVKEIKKVLKQNAKTCLLYDFKKNTDCKVFQCKYILDYINELETLCDKTYKDLTKEIDRLENENAKWKRKAINYYQMAKSYGVECIIDNEIDQLAKENENENLQ